MAVGSGALARHRGVQGPVETLAAFGGFETAMMAGLMLVAASKRQLLVIDGMSACAALMVAARIAAPVTDYCVFCRSRSHHGLDQAMALFQAAPLLELGMDAADGTGALLAWPLVRSAAALLAEVPDGDEPAPSVPAPLVGAAAG
jgi:nicotinate-nucleotide--dimethylbenzimidazole phosphoribosyltransferase